MTAPNVPVGRDKPRPVSPTAPSILPIARDKPWLAPLAGFSDLPFRLLCREYGAAVACTEMVSAKGLVYGQRNPKAGENTESLLATTPDDAPLVVQLFGAEPEFLAEAARILCDRGFSFFDLNMGCSVPKVVKTGSGAALMGDPQAAVRAAAALIKAAAPRPVGVKLRLGLDAAHENYLDIARALEDAGAAWLTLHPRYARQGFSGTARHEASARLVQAVNIPVLLSGDLHSAEDAVGRLAETGAAGVMFARGAMSDPRVFSRHAALCAGREPEPLGAADLRALILRHLELIRLHAPPRLGKRGLPATLLKMRTVIPRYVRLFPGVRELRKKLCAVTEDSEPAALLEDFFQAAAKGSAASKESVPE